jgi:glycosyltransferase involved in cell wall biosynthesis
MIQPKLTIVIPCKNEGMGIIDCLKYIELQSEYGRVVIADSSDKTHHRDGLRQWCQGKDWITIIPGGLPAPARNAGAAYTDTEWILFLDADIMLVDRNIISATLSAMRDKDLVTVSIYDTQTYWDWLWLGFHIVQRIVSKREPFALGGYQMWRREAFFQAGGFDENMKVGEDWMLSRKVRPDRFCIIKRSAQTSGRRFSQWGVLNMIRLMIGGWINRNNPTWFYKSHNYWK